MTFELADDDLPLDHHEAALRSRFPLALRPAAHLAAGSILPPPPLWDGFLLSKTLTMISAEGGTGKSWLMLSMMASLESSLPLCDTWAARPISGRCLYIGLDSSPWDLCKQWSSVCRAHSLAPETIQSDMLLRGGEPIRLTDPSFHTWIKNWIALVRPDAIFLDNFRQAASGLNENDSTQMESIMAFFREWRDLGTTVIFSHHTRKNIPGIESAARDAARGSAALHDAVDFHLHLKKLTPETFRLTIAKGRDDLSGFPPETLLKRIHSTINNLPAVALRPVGPGGSYTALLDLIVSGISDRRALIQSLSATLGSKSESFVNNGLHKLSSLGLIKSEDKHWKPA